METKKRVLVCEDDPVQLAILTAALGQAGYETAGARSPEEALARGPVDAVIADIHLRQGDAFDLLAGLRRSGHDAPPTVMISGGVTPLLHERAIRAGVRGLIEKPCDIPSLVRVVRGFLSPAPAAPRPVLCPRPQIVGRADGELPPAPPAPSRKGVLLGPPGSSTSAGPSWRSLWIAGLALALAGAFVASVLA